MNDRQQLAAIGEHMREMEECKLEFKVPDGWRLVPANPTQNMVDAAKWIDGRLSVWKWADGYREMLAAAPEYKR